MILEHGVDCYTANTLPSDRDLQGLAGKHANYVMMSNLFISSHPVDNCSSFFLVFN